MVGVSAMHTFSSIHTRGAQLVLLQVDDVRAHEATGGERRWRRPPRAVGRIFTERARPE